MGSGDLEITNRNRPDGTPISYPFRIQAHKIKPAVPYFTCPDHGVRLGRGEWVRYIMELHTGIVRLHYICEFMERVTVEEHPDNSIFYHRAPRIRPRSRSDFRRGGMDTDRRLEPF